MTRSRALRLVIGTVLALGAGLLTSCLSHRYRAAPKNTPPALTLNYNGISSEIGVLLHSVIVYKGPGSWREEAYWDEYIVTLTNRTDQPISIRSALLEEEPGNFQTAGDDPWKIEKRSREKLTFYERTGRKIVLGTGLTVVWLGSGVGVLAASVGATSAGLALASVATAVALPAIGLGTMIRTLSAKDDIEVEFRRRRLVLPATLGPNESKSGSLFFPITPGPKRLTLYFPAGDQLRAAALPLAPLAGLHLSDEKPAPGAPAK